MKVLPFLFFLFVCCSHKNQIDRIKHGEKNAYQSVYSVSMKIINRDQQSNLFLPLVDVELRYVVISDGRKSYVQIFNADLGARNDVSLRTNDIYIYSDCEKGVGIVLDKDNNVNSAFALDYYDFVRYKFDTISVLGIDMNCEILKTLDTVQMHIHTAELLPPEVNLGNCYVYDDSKGLFKMQGENKGTRIDISLVEYYQVNFDFYEYDSVINDYNASTLEKSDIFW